jgi:hypothetical protein
MSDLTDFFSSGGGGSSIGDLSLKPSALNANLYVDSNNSTWLKSGVGESDLSLYPDLPTIGLADLPSTNGIRSYVGTSPQGSTTSYQTFRNDSFNNTSYFTKLDNWSGYSYFTPTTQDSDGKIENPYIDGTSTNKRWGNTYYGKNSLNLNSFGTLPNFDGTDHWALMPNFSPTSSNGMPYRGNYTNSVSGQGELNTWKLRKVTGGNTNTPSNGTYTFSAGDDVVPSGVPTAASGYDLSLGATSGSGLGGIRIGSQFAVTDTQILINVKIGTGSYYQYYYYFTYHYPWQVHTFNKSTGAYEGMLYNNSYVINNNGGSGYLILDEPNNPGVTSKRGGWDTGDKSIIYYTKNHAEEFRLSVYVDFGSSAASFGTPVETDNSGRIIMFNPSELDPTQLENAKSNGANTSADNAGGTIDIFEKASGVKTMYSRGITTSSTSDYAAMGINTSNAQVHAGSKITTEDTNNRLYVKAL